MYLRCRTFLILAITYSSYGVLPNEIENCDCDVLQVSGNLMGNQDFTKQNGNLNGKPYYFSKQQDMIYWDKKYWSFEKYNADLEEFSSSTLKFPGAKLFSFENMCQKLSASYGLWTSSCLRENNNCSATKEFNIGLVEVIATYQSFLTKMTMVTMVSTGLRRKGSHAFGENCYSLDSEVDLMLIRQKFG